MPTPTPKIRHFMWLKTPRVVTGHLVDGHFVDGHLVDRTFGRRTLVERTFGRPDFWSNGLLVDRTFGRSDVWSPGIWSTGLLVERTFGRPDIWSKCFYLKTIKDKQLISADIGGVCAGPPSDCRESYLIWTTQPKSSDITGVWCGGEAPSDYRELVHEMFDI